MAWSEVHGHSGGANSGTVTLDSSNANVLVLIVSNYAHALSTANISESGASPNTWTLATVQASDGDGNVHCGLFYVVSPNTNASHGVTYTDNSGFPGMVLYAFSQGAVTSFVTDVGSGAGTTTAQAGSIGKANDLVVEGLAW